MGYPTMAESKTKTRRIGEIIIMIIVLACMALLLADTAINISTELGAQEGLTAIEVIEGTPTAIPTLTEEEYQEFIGIENAGGQAYP